MKRRDFIKTGAVAASVAGSLKILPPLLESESNPQSPPAASGDNRSTEYLRRARSDQFLPKPPEFADVPISPMPLAERVRRKLVPRRGFCSLAPGNGALLSGNGAMNIELEGDPCTEQIPFRHEMLYVPHRRPFEAPKIADIFPQVRQMLLDGKYHEAAAFAYQKWHEGLNGPGGMGFGGGGGFSMRLEFPRNASVKDYLRTVDFESTEVKVHWTDKRGDWVRQTFTSRPDNLVVQRLTAPEGQSVNVRITVSAGGAGMRGGGGGRGGGRGGRAGGPPGGGGGGQSNVQQDINEQRLIYKGHLDPSVNNRGYAGVTRVVRDGGSARMEGNTLVIENATSVMLLTRIEYFPDYSEDKVETVRQSLEGLTPDHPALLERARKVQSEMLNRVTVDFGGRWQYGMSAEELLADQRSRPDFSPALLEKLFEMGRHWFILASGQYPSIAAGINATIDLQAAGAVQGGLREGTAAYFNWMESIAPDCRANAKNIFGFRGASYPLFPDKGIGVNF
jgi:hypothetical protein